MNKIAIVTGFFAIGRENFKNIPRTNNQYITYFKRWARIKNNLIFYCEDKNFGDEVLKIREEFGLKEKTQIVAFEDITKLEPQILNKMQQIENCKYFKDFRVDKNFPENKALYNYIMFLKSYCIYDSRKYIDNSIKYLAWLDFGYEHGGKIFADENDYNFEWNYDFNDKITFFHLNPLDSRPIFEICRTVHPDSQMGAPFIVPVNKAIQFYNIMLECYNSLLDIGLMDDDQLFMLLAHRKYPDIIQEKPSNWFLPIKDYGGSHIKLKPPIKETFISKVKRKLKKVLGKNND